MSNRVASSHASRSYSCISCYISRKIHPRIRTEKGIAAKIPRGSIAAIFRLSVATVAGNVHAVGRYRNAGVTYRIHRWWYGIARNTRYTHPPGTSPLPLPTPPCPSYTHARRACTWNSKCLSLSGAEGAWPSATYRALPRFPFSRSCEEERRPYLWNGKKGKKNTTYNTRGILRICPLSAAALLQFIRIRPFVCMYSKKWGTRPTLSAIPLSLRSPWYRTELSSPSPVSSREVERPFEICRWPKDASRIVLVWPRIRDSYLLTESSRKGVIERPYHLRTSSAATASLCMRRST